jgi:hypothetical protein
MPDDRCNSHRAGAPDASALAAALRALPLATPATSPLPRLKQALAARRRARWRRQWLPALAAAATVATLALLPLARGPTPVQTPTPIAAEPIEATREQQLIAGNRVLEASLRDAGLAGSGLSAGSIYASTELEDLIGMLDLELGASSNARAREQLWAQRLVLMQELVAVRSGEAESLFAGDAGAYVQNADLVID